MVNSVSFGNANAIYTPKKKSTKKGAAIGAGVGLAYCTANFLKSRQNIPQILKAGIRNGLSKNKAIGLFTVGLVVGGAIITGACALVGKGVNALVNHFKKDKVDPKSVKV